MSTSVTDAFSQTPEQLFSLLKTNLSGLSEQEAAKRLTIYGQNRLTEKKKISPLKIFIEQFTNTLTLILIGSAFLILFIYFFGEHDRSDLLEAGLILAIVVMIAVLGFLQEYKAEKAIESLKKLLAFKTRVRRGLEKDIDVINLVPGDIVLLEEGAKIPADIRLLQTFSLNVNEAPLTGESTPIHKTIETLQKTTQLNDQKNMVFSGTTIVSGKGIGVVVNTGDTTELGKIAHLVSESEEDETPMQKQLDSIGKVLGYGVLGICAVVFIFIVFFAKEFLTLPLLQRIIQSFIASVSLAVAAIPEGLPGVAVITLALGTQRMLAKHALIRKLNSTETLGSTDIICSDKTGTLTKGEMTVTHMFFQQKTHTVSGTGYEEIGTFALNQKQADQKPLQILLAIGIACNNAKIQDHKILGDPTEAALLISAKKAGVQEEGTREFEVPFSSERKKMSVVVKKGNDYFVYTKGAPEVVLQSCTDISLDKEKPITKAHRKEILTATQDMSEQALRVLGFAYKKISAKEYQSYKEVEKKIESDLTFVGLQGMIDPPRPEVKPLIEQCKSAGIQTIMITGDHAATAQAIAHQISINGKVLTGEQLDMLSEEEFIKQVEQIAIYARVNPEHKMRIVNALKKNNHIVAMTGDGVNDAPALKRADIGIAMGITGTDVAKESSDMVLLDDKFSTIIAAVEEGRAIFQNIRKFVTYLLACNIGEVLIVFFAVMIFQDVPLTATMLLWINVVTDGLPAVALGLDPAAAGIMKKSPRSFQTNIITVRQWVEMILIGLVMTVCVLSIYVFNVPEGVLEAKGAAFTAIVILELMYVLIIRANEHASFFSNKWLLLAVFGSVLLQIIIVYIPFLAFLFEVKHIDPIDWVMIIASIIVLWSSSILIRHIVSSHRPKD